MSGASEKTGPAAAFTAWLGPMQTSFKYKVHYEVLKHTKLSSLKRHNMHNTAVMQGQWCRIRTANLLHNKPNINACLHPNRVAQ